MKMIDQFVNFVIRPPRVEYNPDQYLWEKDFTLAGRAYERQDLELRNKRGHILQCSHYVPSPFPKDTPLPCVIYCHGNSGCRADANEAVVVLLPSNITVFTLDFSGSGLSHGDYVSLGWHEKDDLKVVVSYLRSNRQISHIGLWGRSMGAVTSLLYGAEDPSIAGMVLDSAFANLYDLMLESVDFYKIRIPKFTVKMAVQYMRRVIQKKAKFDIMDLNCLQVARNTFIPALFGHGAEDKFIYPFHSDLIYKSYAGDKNIIKFDGDHNSCRPQFYYDSASIFFLNVLCPPDISSAYSSNIEKYYDLGGREVGVGMNERILYEIITGLRNMSSSAASSSSAPASISNTELVGDCLSEISLVASAILEVETFRCQSGFSKGSTMISFQEKQNGQIEDCSSCTSSNRESWGRCSSLGGSIEEPSAEHVRANDSHQAILKALTTPIRRIRQKPSDQAKEVKKKTRNKFTTFPKRPKREKFEKLEMLSQRLRHCILKRVCNRRHRSP